MPIIVNMEWYFSRSRAIYSDTTNINKLLCTRVNRLSKGFNSRSRGALHLNRNVSV